MQLDRMSDRCKRICGRNDKHCFINHKEQINCIADMVVNKATEASMLLDFSLGRIADLDVKENIDESTKIINELSNWIQYLQLVQNLQKLSSLMPDSGFSKERKEIRYPVPAGMEQRIKLNGKSEQTTFDAQLMNFSQSGMGFTGSGLLEIGSIFEFTVSDLEGNDYTPFIVQIRYSVKTNGYYLNGGLIQEVKGKRKFNFFNTVFRFLSVSIH